MAKSTKVLLIVEGAKREVELVRRLFEEYKLQIEREIYVYGTNIYELYERVFEGHENEMDSIDLLQKLKEKDLQNPVLDQTFSDIILIFDYDPQDNIKDIQDWKNAYYSIKDTDILEKQNNMLIQEKNLYVLNTCIFFICDYNFNLIEK